MKDFQNDFYYILSRYGNKSSFKGRYEGKKNPSKTSTEEYEKNCRCLERDEKKLISMWEEMNERINSNRKRV